MTTRYLQICIEKGMGYPKRISIVSIVNYFRTKTNNQQPKSIFKRTKQRKELVTRTFGNPLDFILILLKNGITNLEKKTKTPEKLILASKKTNYFRKLLQKRQNYLGVIRLNFIQYCQIMSKNARQFNLFN